MDKELLVKGFEVGRGLTQDNFEEQDWNDLEELIKQLKNIYGITLFNDNYNLN